MVWADTVAEAALVGSRSLVPFSPYAAGSRSPWTAVSSGERYNAGQTIDRFGARL
jgi:hypothetical protein